MGWKDRMKVIAKREDWKKTSSAYYKGVPHEYLVFEKNGHEFFQELEEIIREHGEYRNWRGHKFKYLIHGGYCYWHMGRVINRSYEEALDNDGYPGKRDQARIFKRFWGGK